MAVLVKIRKTKQKDGVPNSKRTQPLAHRVTFGTNVHSDTCDGNESNEYDYTTIIRGISGQIGADKDKSDNNIIIATEGNVAYATNVMFTEQNVAYGQMPLT